MIPKTTNYRDLTLLELGEDVIVIACDSVGAIGAKKNDFLKTSGRIVGRFTARVPLMEVMAAGAEPLVIVNTLSVEMEPSGKEIISGIKAELTAAGLTDITITGSTEENMPTTQTGAGITVIGRTTTKALRLGRAQAGNLVYCLGRPRVGTEVLNATLPDIPLLRKLLAQEWITEILPVGSKGLLYEAGQLAAGAGAGFTLNAAAGVDVHCSAGPATSLLIATAAERAADLAKLSDLDIFYLGKLHTQC
ncbi:MAG TPA: hypothetical protein GX699_08290 [Firmicutes bacterium]|nr:hypothetical protein [Bacillota bacterium]